MKNTNTITKDRIHVCLKHNVNIMSTLVKKPMNVTSISHVQILIISGTRVECV